MGLIEAIEGLGRTMKQRAAANASADAGPARPAGVDMGDDVKIMGNRLAAECKRLGVSDRHVTDAERMPGWTKEARMEQLSVIENTLTTIDAANRLLESMPATEQARLRKSAQKLRKDLGLTSSSTPYDLWTQSADAYLTRLKATANEQFT